MLKKTVEQALPETFPLWPGLLLGVIVFGALAQAVHMHWIPRGIGRAVDWYHMPAHAMAAFVLLPQLADIRRLRTAARIARGSDETAQEWVRPSVDDQLANLDPKLSHSLEDLHRLIDAGEVSIARAYQQQQLLYFVIPLAMVIVSWVISVWSINAEYESVLFPQQFSPVLFATVEAVVAVIVAAVTTNLTSNLLGRWNHLAKKVAANDRRFIPPAKTSMPSPVHTPPPKTETIGPSPVVRTEPEVAPGRALATPSLKQPPKPAAKKPEEPGYDF